MSPREGKVLLRGGTVAQPPRAPTPTREAVRSGNVQKDQRDSEQPSTAVRLMTQGSASRMAGQNPPWFPVAERPLLLGASAFETPSGHSARAVSLPRAGARPEPE